MGKSRWEDDEDPEQIQREKDAKRRAREAAKAAKAAKAQAQVAPPEPPPKRRRLSNDGNGDRDGDADSKGPAQASAGGPDEDAPRPLRLTAPEWRPCRHIDNFEALNHIEEGSYGLVSRARETATGTVVALKQLKMDARAPDGFPVTGLREIQTLLESRHENVLALHEVVMGDAMDEVYLVMEFVEHDLKTLLDDMREPFLPSEVKTLMGQLLAGVEYLHNHWIIHRDLKTSNLLLTNRGELKIADFGMARYYGDPPPHLTQLVVTLWYRSPELLLGTTKYGLEIDMWSVGCVFGELLTKEPLLQGKNEVNQLAKIFALTGPPTGQTWPGFRALPNSKSLRLPPPPQSQVTIPSSNTNSKIPLLPRTKFPYITTAGLILLSSLLALNPSARPTASEARAHTYFREDPRPKARAMFPTFPSKAGMEKRRRHSTPDAPRYGGQAPGLGEVVDFGGLSYADHDEEKNRGAGFALRQG